jgi:hypothetical protein
MHRFKDKAHLLKHLNEALPDGSLSSLGQLSDGTVFAELLAQAAGVKVPEGLVKTEKESIWVKNWMILDKILSKEGYRIEPEKMAKGRFF